VSIYFLFIIEVALMNDPDYIETLEIIALNVKKFREKKGFSQLNLALEAECSRTQISRIENRDVNPSIFTLSKIARALDKKISDLFIIKDKEATKKD